jgi:hypothetical protein
MAYTTIDLPTEYFNTVLYTGNGTAIGSGGQCYYRCWFFSRIGLGSKKEVQLLLINF